MPNYEIKQMSAERLKVKRDHSNERPAGRTAELIGHVDWQEAEICALKDSLYDAIKIIKMFRFEPTHCEDGYLYDYVIEEVDEFLETQTQA